MTVNKLERFAQNADFDHVLEHTDFHDQSCPNPRGHWHEQVFSNNHPITLELACGTAAYTLHLASHQPKRNYIGIDIKGARLWKGAKKAKAKNLANVRFLRIYIDHIDVYFSRNEVDEIWITFPDPYPRPRDRGNRLTAPKFLRLYKKIVSPGGIVHLKTDDTDLFNYSLRSVKKFGGTVQHQVADIYGSQAGNELLTVKTKYEKKHLQNNKAISYCRFTLN